MIVPAEIFAKWRAGVNVVELVVMPPRMPRGHPDNNKRVAIPCYALHQLHVARMTDKRRVAHSKGCSHCRFRVPWKIQVLS